MSWLCLSSRNSATTWIVRSMSSSWCAAEEGLLREAARLSREQGARQLSVRVAVSRAELAREAGDPKVFDQAIAEVQDVIRDLPEGSSSWEVNRGRELAQTT